MKTYLSQSILSIQRCIILLFTAILFGSCLHLYYAPNSSNVPLFKEKGEAKINANYSGGAEISGAEIQGAYAVSEHVGIMLNTAFLGSSEEYSDGQKDEGNGYLVEAGAGYFMPLAENFIFETYAGLGVGGANNEYYYGGNSKVNFTKFFIQPALGFSVKNVDFGAASRFSAVFMNVQNTSGVNTIDLPDLQYIEANPTSILWEPSLFVRFGFESVKAQLKYTPSLNLNNQELAQETYLLGLGLSFAINPPKNKTSRNGGAVQ